MFKVDLYLTGLLPNADDGSGTGTSSEEVLGVTSSSSTPSTEESPTETPDEDADEEENVTDDDLKKDGVMVSNNKESEEDLEDIGSGGDEPESYLDYDA